MEKVIGNHFTIFLNSQIIKKSDIWKAMVDLKGDGIKNNNNNNNKPSH